MVIRYHLVIIGLLLIYDWGDIVNIEERINFIKLLINRKKGEKADPFLLKKGTNEDLSKNKQKSKQ